MAETQLATQSEEEQQSYHFRDGNLFVIDVSPEMFEIDPEQGSSYFINCLHCYARILSQKLLWNKTDWMGLIAFNATKDWDRDPESKNIWTLLKFEEVSVDMMKELTNIINNKAEKEHYVVDNPPSGFEMDGSLHDVLWQACRTFDPIKISMPLRQVVLLTRRDNPLIENEAERHKIRLRAKAFLYASVKLRIVGLGADWNHELFYKDVDLLASNKKSEDFKRTKLDDLEGQVKFLARITDHLRCKIDGDTEMRLFVKPFASKTQCLKRVRMHKDTNEILEPMTRWVLQFADDEEENFTSNEATSVLYKGVNRGGKMIIVHPEELKKMRRPMEPGISILGFKPISLELIFHLRSANYIGIDNKATIEEKHLFAALLKNCAAKKVMAICSVSQRSLPYLAKMIPSLEYGGFYLYKIGNLENLNDLRSYTQHLPSGKDGKVSLPLSPESLSITNKIVKKLRMVWQPYKFSNPKLINTMQYIEALALDWEYSLPEDTTRSQKQQMDERLGGIVQKFHNTFPNTIKVAKKRKVPASETGSRGRGAKKAAS